MLYVTHNALFSTRFPELYYLQTAIGQLLINAVVTSPTYLCVLRPLSPPFPMPFNRRPKLLLAPFM
jgi:hypothetical protein